MGETKVKTNSSLRTPKPKKLGLSVPPALRLPHEDLIMSSDASSSAESRDLLNSGPSTLPSRTGLTTQPSQPGMTGVGRYTQDNFDQLGQRRIPGQQNAIQRVSGGDEWNTVTSQPSQTGHTSHGTSEQHFDADISPTSVTSHGSMTSQATRPDLDDLPVAPIRDFMKVANSIGRTAVPAGMFTGKSKQLYDCLYGLTRGSIVPSRVVRMSRPKLMKRAHIGSRVTFDANVNRLLAVGLISVRQISGEHEGNEYTVYLPEETNVQAPGVTSHTSQSSNTSWSASAQDLAGPDSLESGRTSPTLSTVPSDSSGLSKTFLKTSETNDDEVFAELTAALKTAITKITGALPKINPSERARWGELGQLLSAEVLDAASRSAVISSVPAFLVEHLRRRLNRRPHETSQQSFAVQQSPPGVGDNLPERAQVRLSSQQIAQSAEMLSELLSRGDYTVDSITEQFSAGFSKADWTEVLNKAIGEGSEIKTESDASGS